MRNREPGKSSGAFAFALIFLRRPKDRIDVFIVVVIACTDGQENQQPFAC